MQQQKRYVGIHNDLNGGMTDSGKIIRSAWAFGIIPETETCEGWFAHGIEDLWEKVNAEWEKYGFRVAGMPDDIRAKYMDIQAKAVERARAAGWEGEHEISSE